MTAEYWLDNLPVQTLTDELKQEIIEQFEADRIRFAKQHVIAALKSAAENAQLDDIGCHNGEEWISHTIVDKDSILKSYPLDKIR